MMIACEVANKVVEEYFAVLKCNAVKAHDYQNVNCNNVTRVFNRYLTLSTRIFISTNSTTFQYKTQ